MRMLKIAFAAVVLFVGLASTTQAQVTIVDNTLGTCDIEITLRAWSTPDPCLGVPCIIPWTTVPAGTSTSITTCFSPYPLTECRIREAGTFTPTLFLSLCNGTMSGTLNCGGGSTNGSWSGNVITLN